MQKKKEESDNDEIYYLNQKINGKTKTIAQLKTQLEDFVQNSAYWQNAMAQVNHEIEGLQVRVVQNNANMPPN